MRKCENSRVRSTLYPRRVQFATFTIDFVCTYRVTIAPKRPCKSFRFATCAHDYINNKLIAINFLVCTSSRSSRKGDTNRGRVICFFFFCVSFRPSYFTSCRQKCTRSVKCHMYERIAQLIRTNNTHATNSNRQNEKNKIKKKSKLEIFREYFLSCELARI